MSLATSNRDGGKTNESGHLRAIMKAVVGEVLTGLAVSQRGAGANMSVDIAIGDAIIPRSDNTYGHPAWNDAVYNLAINTADASNPRRDIVVMYIDYNQAPSTAVSNNTNGVVKIAVVAGTPAGSPSDPSGATIQSAVGSGNPYIRLARVRVAAGTTTISNSVIDDLRVMATGLDNGGWISVPAADIAAWAFSSFNATTRIGIITVPTDATTRYKAGMWIKFYQATGGWKYAYITAVTATTITANFFNSYTLNNEAIIAPSYSMRAAPFGAPNLPVIYTDAAGWSVHDHGSYKEWFKTATDNPNYGSGTATLRAALGAGVPTGYSNFDGFDVKMSWSVSGNAHNWRVHIESGISGVAFFNANVSTAAADWKDIRVWWRLRRSS